MPIPMDVAGTTLVADVLDRAVQAAPGKEALVDRFRRYDYAALAQEVDRAARGFARLGIRPGDRVAACLPNRAEIVVAFLAIMRLGAVWVGVPPALATSEKEYLLSDSGATALLSTADVLDELRPLRARLTSLRHLIDADSGTAGSEATAWEELLAAGGGETPSRAVDPYAPAAIAYTSGTTGFPKGVVHSQYNLVLPSSVMVATGQAPSDWRYGVCLPLVQLNLLVCSALLAFRAVATSVIIDRRDPVGIAEAVRRERVSTLSVPSTILQRLVDDPAVDPSDLATLVHPIAGGTSCPTAIKERFRRRFGHHVYVRYGSTEVPTVAATERPRGGEGSPDASDRLLGPDFVGTVLPHLRVTTVDELGRPLPEGATGEICLEPARDGPWAGAYRFMLGYWNQPEATAERLAGGRLHTGDIGWVDADGNLYLSGRVTDMIIRGGSNIYPAEVERVLASHPAVAHCAVAGRPDPHYGERVVAFVQLADGHRADAAALQAHCATHLASYKVPEEVVFVSRLPRNALGKVDKRALLDQLTDSATPAAAEADR